MRVQAQAQTTRQGRKQANKTKRQGKESNGRRAKRRRQRPKPARSGGGHSWAGSDARRSGRVQS
eukprot:1327257-Pleurochrysis_carterae.AAC.1